MATLVFDIETVGKRWEDLDVITQGTLTRWIPGVSTSTDETALHEQRVKDQLGLSPLTGSIVSVSMYDVERKQGVVYVVTDEALPSHTAKTGYKIKTCTEKELLEDFWEGARSYDVFVSFSGRRFDVPYVLHRSVICGVKPTVELAKHKYLKQQTYPYHIDLQDELTFDGAMYKRPSLHLFCTAYGIPSPKLLGGGREVAVLVEAANYIELANYNAADVAATTALYEKWKQYLAPASFINTLEF